MASHAIEAESSILERFPGNDPRATFLRECISPSVSNPLVMYAFASVNRIRFAPEEEQHLAWTDNIIHLDGATMSQPSLVAKMMELLALSGQEKVLEIGTASGVGAAYLSHCSREVHTIDVNKHLANEAQKRLRDLGYRNIHVHVGDGLLGLPHEAPFEAIIVTAAARSIPQTFVDQLVDGGRIVLPVGKDDNEDAQLIVGVKERGKLIIRPTGGVFFMPLMSEHEGGWTKDQLQYAIERRRVMILQKIEQAAKKIGTTVEELQQQYVAEIREGEVVPSIDEINAFIYRVLNNHGLI